MARSCPAGRTEDAVEAIHPVTRIGTSVPDARARRRRRQGQPILTMSTAAAACNTRLRARSRGARVFAPVLATGWTPTQGVGMTGTPSVAVELLDASADANREEVDHPDDL